MKLISSTILICIGIYIAFNHPDIAQVMYGYFMQSINFVVSLFGKVA